MNNEESREQQALIQWAATLEPHYPQLKLLHAIPNGGKRNVITASILKREGVKSGVPDLDLPIAKGGYIGLRIEMKAKKGKTSENQDNWIEMLRDEGHRVSVCYNWDEAKCLIMRYLNGLERRVQK